MRIVPRLREGRRLPGGLALRVGLMVLACALATTGVVTWVSVRSVESFVRERLDTRPPTLLRDARERATLWYDERSLALEGLARSELLRRHAAARAGGSGGRASAEATRAEAARLLRSLLEASLDYRTLLVLDREGRVLLRAGSGPALPGGLREELAGTRESRVGPLRPVAGRRLQIASAPVRGPDGEPAASVHAVLRLDGLAARLGGAALPERTTLRLLDGAGEPVLAERAGPAPLVPPSGAEGDEVAVRRDASGEPHATASLPFGRFGWRLVLREPHAPVDGLLGTTVRRALAVELVAVALLAAAVFAAVGAWRVRPLERLAEAARRLAAGESDVVVPMPKGDDEIRSLAKAMSDMASRLQAGRMELESRNAELQRANEVLEQLSITDGLTKLHNHRHFQDQLAHEARRAERTGQPLCLILMDVDDFKGLNDRLGHSAGDRVLERVAQAMTETLRETDYLARYGGEEFALLAPDTDLDGAHALAEKLRATVAACPLPLDPEEGPEHVTISVGVAPYAKSPRATFDAADRALYEAKEAGKDCVVRAAG